MGAERIRAFQFFAMIHKHDCGGNNKNDGDVNQICNGLNKCKFTKKMHHSDDLIKKKVTRCVLSRCDLLGPLV